MWCIVDNCAWWARLDRVPKCGDQLTSSPLAILSLNSADRPLHGLTVPPTLQLGPHDRLYYFYPALFRVLKIHYDSIFGTLLHFTRCHFKWHHSTALIPGVRYVTHRNKAFFR